LRLYRKKTLRTKRDDDDDDDEERGTRGPRALHKRTHVKTLT